MRERVPGEECRAALRRRNHPTLRPIQVRITGAMLPSEMVLAGIEIAELPNGDFPGPNLRVGSGTIGTVFAQR